MAAQDVFDQAQARLRSTFGPGWRARLEAVVDGSRFQIAIMALIILNAIILGLETSERMVRGAGGLLGLLDGLILAVFVVEIAVRIAA